MSTINLASASMVEDFSDVEQCADCGAQHNTKYGESLGNYRRGEDGAIYCTEQSCWRDYQKLCFHAAIDATVVPELKAVIDHAGEIAAQYGLDESDTAGALEEAAAHIDAEVKGEPSRFVYNAVAVERPDLKRALDALADVAGYLEIQAAREQKYDQDSIFAALAMQSVVRVARVRQLLDNALATANGVAQPWHVMEGR